MEIRHYSHIEWNDLPRIEAPSLALDKIGCRFTNRLSPGARQIRGLGEAFRRCRFRLGRFDPSEDERVDNHALLTNVGNGEFVIIHDGEWEYPMCSALRWCTENNPDGFHIPSPSNRITWLSLPPEGRWIADFRLPMLLRSQIEQCLERGRRDAS
ncbi:MAG: hypothetical protein LBF50_00275, partial [Azoarcus sp.]|nr:hypothetical protein [Azoarcus sp.]